MAQYRSRPYRRKIPSGIDAISDSSSKMPQVAVKGDLLWFDGADMQRIPAGAAGEILRMVNGIPTWQTLAEAGIAPNTPDFLVGTSDAALTGEIVVGTTPGGELGNTWASPTVDSVHSGSAHPTAASTTEVLTGTDTAKFVTPDALAALWEKGGDIASADPLSVGEGGFFHVTGTTTITDIDFGTDKTGRKVILVFDGALILTHNATSLILPTGANITTAAGDVAVFVSEGTDNVRCVFYMRKDGTALAGGSGGHVIKDEAGAGLTARTNLNFTGAGVEATDNAGTDSTDVTISGGGSGDSVTVNGSATTDVDLDDADPAAPTGQGVNVKWQLNTATSPDSVSAYVPLPGWIYDADLIGATATNDYYWDGNDLAGFTEVDITGTTTWTEDKNLISVLVAGMTAEDANCVLIAKTFSIGDAWVVPVIGYLCPAVSAAARAGIIFTDGTVSTSNAVFGHIQLDNTTPGNVFLVGRHGTLTSVATAPWVSDNDVGGQFVFYIKLEYPAANTFRLWFSPDGVTYHGFGEADISKTMTPTHVGLAVMVSDADGGIFTFGPLRKVA